MLGFSLFFFFADLNLNFNQIYFSLNEYILYINYLMFKKKGLENFDFI